MEKTLKVGIKDVSGHKDAKLIKVIGDLDKNSVVILNKAVEQDIEQGIINLIFDLSELDFIDSSGNLCFIRFYARMKYRGGSVKFFKINDKIREILELVGISKIIPSYESFEKVLLSFKEEKK